MRLNRDDIIAGLTELATRMDAASIAATIHVVGGSAISIEYNHLRESTTDVDSWLHVHHTLADAVDAIVREIAIERQWPDDWFNTRATMFLPEFGEPFAWRTLFEIGVVRILVAPPRRPARHETSCGQGPTRPSGSRTGTSCDCRGQHRAARVGRRLCGRTESLAHRHLRRCQGEFVFRFETIRRPVRGGGGQAGFAVRFPPRFRCPPSARTGDRSCEEPFRGRRCQCMRARKWTGVETAQTSDAGLER